MKKNKKRKKTPRYIQEQYWSTTMMVDDELVDLINVWHFYYYAAAIIVPLLEDFLDIAEFKIENVRPRVFYKLPEESVGVEDFSEMISNINLLVRYNSEGGLKYGGRDISFVGGDKITELTDALHLFANLLPYLNDRYFHMSEERYEDVHNGRHSSFDELCNLDKTIARRIFNTLQVFAAYSLLPPSNFKRSFYPNPDPDTSLTKIVFSAMNGIMHLKQWSSPGVGFYRENLLSPIPALKKYQKKSIMDYIFSQTICLRCKMINNAIFSEQRTKFFYIQ